MMSTQQTPTTPPAGWYPDPQNPAAQRYWDGAAWASTLVGPRPTFTGNVVQRQPQAQVYQPVQFQRFESRNGFGITALVLGIIGLVLGIIPILGIPAIILGLVGLVFGGLGLGRVRRGVATNKAMSWTGVVLSTLALTLGIIGCVIVTNAANQLSHDLDNISTTSTR